MGKTAELRGAARDGEQDVGDARLLQIREHGADLVRGAEQCVLLRAAGFARVSQHMRAAGSLRLARYIDRALGIGGLANERGLFIGLVLGDIKLPRHRDLHRIEGKALRLALGFIDADALGDLRGAGILIEDQIEAARGGAADRRRAAGRHPKRRMRPLRRRRLDHDVLEMPEAAMMGKTLAAHEGAPHHFDGLVETRLGLLRRDLEPLEFAVPVTLADAEIEAAARNQIEGGGLFGKQHRIMPGQHHHRRAEPQRLGSHGERHQQHQRRRDLVPAGEMMFDEKARPKAERLGLDIEVEIVAEPLPALRTERLIIGLRRTEDAELHANPSFPDLWPTVAWIGRR